MSAIKSKNKQKLVSLLKDKTSEAQPKPNLNFTDNSGNTALHYSILLNNKCLSWILLAEQGLNPNVQDTEGNTPLHIAVEKNKDLIILENLLRLASIETNLKNKLGETPLLMAARMQKERPVKLIASHPTSQIEEREMQRIGQLANGTHI